MFELVVQCGLEDPDVENALAHLNRGGVRTEAVAVYPALATKKQYDRMVAEGLGDLDKSDIAELPFKDRHKHPGNRV